MPHNCTDYPWFIQGGTLMTRLDDQMERNNGQPGWALYYDVQSAYTALVNLERRLRRALNAPRAGTAGPWDGPGVPPEDVEALATLAINTLPDDENNNPPGDGQHVHVPNVGWLLTPQNAPNWPAIQRAGDLLQRVRSALDMPM